ncbi:hypothetical protein [Wenzhouxiangella marina]|uniref:Uncharacterized protein n=1 Tax=Wenzhouxiangella marina TaxID=1579979 RepID=A0A0K0XVB6_9GAMM|nr:hypothetical protein [Wenzhouxiangella marina]AKS41567.1 hypothetical protein WM2015_1193 [Wenzhouxiangella marina]MBB6086674.1 hypothetical protein [Wenzhouxiangella marina]
MKLLERYEFAEEAQERAAFLRSRGIAAHVESLTALRPAAAHRNLYHAALWAILDHQADDAEALLKDPDHLVRDPLDEREMNELIEVGGDQARRTMIKWGLIALAGLLALAMALPLLF